MNKLRWSAIWRAAITVATFALPIGLLQKWLVESHRIDKGGAANLLLYLAILFTGMLGGYAAGKLEPDGGVQNGAAASFLAGLSIAVGGAIRRSIVGLPVSSPVGWINLALLMATCAMLGAVVERRSRGLLPGPHDREG